MIQVRKLVAVELTFLGRKLVFAEYGFAVVVGAVIGILSLRVGLQRTHALWQELVGIYLLFLAFTYAVLLGLAIATARRGDAREEIPGELYDVPAAFRKYRKQSLWLLVPLAVPLAAIQQR
jgi:Ca2+/Na+ antiporter